jgi:transcriptional regulator with XRE-family HTH domain
MPEAHSITGSSPTLRRRELGALLRALRNEQGLTVEQAAAELLCSPSKVSRMETGQRGATPRDIRDLCRLYGVTNVAEQERLMTLAKEGKQQGWWQSFAVPLPYMTYVGLEQEAAVMSMFQSSVVPGLLQTADYTRAIHRNGIPRLEDSAIEERVEERLKRRQILTREAPPLVEVMLDEAVLRRPLGGPAVMRDQLTQLIAETDRQNVTIRVLPYEIGAHPALESNFTLLEFVGQAPTVVYVEGLVGQIYLERQQDVDRYMLALELLRGMALSPQDSTALVARVRDTYTNG